MSKAGENRSQPGHHAAGIGPNQEYGELPKISGE